MHQMNEAELAMTEAAARAAGYEARRFRVRELEVVHVGVGDQWALFDPLRHDGDAFRLQIDCRLVVNVGRQHAMATAYPGGVALTLLEDMGDKPAAAVRRAITRAAAAMYERRRE